MSARGAESTRIEHDLGIALDDVDLAALNRAKSRGAGYGDLVEEVLVHETWFFRDPAVFDALVQFARVRGTPLRILSAPCSTGEEAYSCAIALREAGVPLDQCTIVGVDVSEPALMRAAAGRYASTAFRSTKTGWEGDALGPPEAGVRTITPELRAAVQLRAANLVSDDALAGEAPFDVVLCRNLIVYLTPEARARIARVMQRLVAPGGLLFLGHAEELAGFERFGPASALSFRAASGIVPIPEMARAVPAASSAQPPRPKSDALETARALADRGLLEDAITLAQRAVRDATQLGDAAEAYALLGTIESARGRTEPAIRAWQRALYLDAKHEIAAVSLATALRARGETDRADALLAHLARGGRSS